MSFLFIKINIYYKNEKYLEFKSSKLSGPSANASLLVYNDNIIYGTGDVLPQIVADNQIKPNTRYYVFMENQDMTEYAVPKLLPVVMTKGSFSTADLMYSVENPPGTAGKASIHFRLTDST
mgnify:CR=1 FL=1